MRASALLFGGILFALSASIGGCKDDPVRPPVLSEGADGPSAAGGGGSRDGGATEDGGDVPDDLDAGSCTDLENVATAVDQNAVTGDLPAGIGGTVADGVYTLVEARTYLGLSGVPGPTGITYQTTIRVTGTLFERVLRFESSGGTSSEIRSSGTFTQTGATGTIALTCPSTNTESVTFSATENGLTLSNLVTKESFVFARQL